MDEKHPAQNGKKTNILLRLLALLLTAALVLGALALVVYRDRFNLDSLNRWLTYRSMETTQTGQAAPFSHSGGSKMSIALLSGGVLTASSTGARYYAPDGELYAEEVLPLDNPILSVSSSTGVVYDAGGQSLFVFQKGRERSDLSLEKDLELLSVRPNESGWLAVTAQQSGYKGSVTVYNNDHQPQIQINLSSTFVVDAAVSPDCKTVAVVTMNQEGGVFFSRLLFFSMHKQEPLSQVELGNMMVLDLDYEKEQLWLLGSDRLTVVSTRKDNTAVSYSFGREYLKGCDLGGDGFAFLLTGPYRAGSANSAFIIDAQGQAVHTLELSGQVLDHSAAGGYCALLTGSHLTIYDQQLTPYATLSDPQGARQVCLARDGSALLANEQLAWLYLPN